MYGLEDIMKTILNRLSTGKICRQVCNCVCVCVCIHNSQQMNSNSQKMNEGLTPKGHRPLGEHHFHDLHRQVSSLLSVYPPTVPLCQTFEPGLV